MFILTLHDGRRALYRGRASQGCVLVLFPDNQWWSWIPNAFIAHGRPVSVDTVVELHATGAVS